MSSTALFGAGPVRSKNLVEFKAGRMNLRGKMVHPDKRKGLVYVYQSDDSLMHFCWKDRTNGLVEDDLMIFPDDVEIKKVAQCTTGRVFLMRFKSSNKKFFFWMQESDPDKDEKLWKKVNDLLNNPSSSAAAAAASSSSMTSAGGGVGLGGGERGVGSSGAGSAGLPSIADFAGLESAADFHSLIGSMSEQQLQMFLGGLMPGMVSTPPALAASRSSSSSTASSSLASSNQASRVQSTTGAASRAEAASTSTQPASAATTTTTTTGAVDSKPDSAATATNGTSKASTAAVEPAANNSSSNGGSGSGTKAMQFAEFQNILGSLAAAQQASGAVGGGGRSTDLDLSEVLTLDMMAPILGNKEVQARLVEHLPESPEILLAKNEHELRQTLTTPQFKKALSSFCMALQSGQLGPVFKQFGLPDEVANAAAQGNLEAFARAMEAHAKEKKTASTTTAAAAATSPTPADAAKKAQDQDDAMDTK